MEPEFVIYNGVEMRVTQAQALVDSQSIQMFSKVGADFLRVRYGAEEDETGAKKAQNCKACGARAGQFHAIGCEAERCPLCGQQAMSCRHGWYAAPREESSSSSDEDE